MAKRFRALERALKYIQSPTSVTPVDAPTGSALRLYQDWKGKKRTITYERDTNSNPDKILRVAVNPFAYEPEATNLAIVAYSQRASTAGVATSMASSGNITLEVPEGAQNLKGFRPAKATVFIGTGSTGGTPEPSSITGIKYKKRPGTSYSFPYGCSSTDKRESEVRKKIRIALKTVANSSVSFTSEKI